MPLLVLDLHARKTEADWEDAYHSVVRKLVEGAFRLLGWLTATAALGALAQRSGSPVLHWAFYGAHALVLLYISSLANHGLHIKVFRAEHLSRWQLWVSVAVNAAAIMPFWWVLTVVSARLVDAASKLTLSPH